MWEEVWSGVPQGSVLHGPLLFLIYIRPNDLQEDVISNVFKFADDTKLFRQVTDTVDTVGMQEDLDRLVERADKWQMQFNVSKCKVMHVGKKNPRHSYYTSSNGLKSVEVEKDLGIMITSDLKFSQQCEYAYSKANRVTGMIRRTITVVEHRSLTGVLLLSCARPAADG